VGEDPAVQTPQFNSLDRLRAALARELACTLGQKSQSYQNEWGSRIVHD
jgi:hypothetical protein